VALCYGPLSPQFGERCEKSFVDFAAISTDMLISMPPLSYLKTPITAAGFHAPRQPGAHVQVRSAAAPSNPVEDTHAGPTNEPVVERLGGP
jgi:hypothetical protein